MAKFEEVLNRDFDLILHGIEEGIRRGSISASTECRSDFRDGYSRCAVRVFEQYRHWGSTRITVTLFQGEAGPVYLSAITSSGSRTLFRRGNSPGEESFLNQLRQVI